MTRALLPAVFIIVMSTAPAFAAGQVLHVSVDGSDTAGDGSQANPYETIGHGLSEASAEDTVLVGPGDYEEAVALVDGVVLQGCGSGETTIVGWVTAESVGRGAVICDIAVARRLGFSSTGIRCAADSSPTVTRTRIEGHVSRRDGAGIYCGPRSSPLIRDNVIIDNEVVYTYPDTPRAYYGAGIYCDTSSSVNIINNTISGNRAIGYQSYYDDPWGGASWYPSYCGGGIACYSSAATITGNTIRDNLAASAGDGIYAVSSTVTIQGNTIASEETSGISGGISLYYCQNARVLDNTISGNSGGGVSLYECPRALISGNTISRNRSNGVRLERGSCTIEANTISRNDAGHGGAILCGNPRVYASWGPADVTIRSNTISGNSGQYGAGIYFGDEISAIVTGNAITGNAARSEGGGVALYRTDPYRSMSITITANQITTNTAVYMGGGIYCRATYSPVLIQGNEIAGNVAGNRDGGGIYAPEYGSESRIVGNRIMRNSAGRYGGGVLAGGECEVAGNDIGGNIASVGGGIYSQAFPSIVNNVIFRNWARRGGGVSALHAPRIVNDTIVNNEAGERGAGVYYEADSRFSSATLTNCIVWNAGDDLAGIRAQYSDVQDGDAGTGNMRAVPGFVAGWQDDYRLNWYSACIDRGKNSIAPVTDKDGSPRIVDGDGDGAPEVDIGAYEHPRRYRAVLGKPWIRPSLLTRSRPFYVLGYLQPIHPGYTTLYFYRLVSVRQNGRWVREWRYLTRRYAKNLDYKGVSRYCARTQFKYPGYYSVRAYHHDWNHAPTWSPRLWFRVR
ncbi:MAG: hypothetical protein C4521_08180 [Actinobacteria bacterium]|nr:MAG: hypothetical protein C4521_08180 [Actinomycetota bacterium]